VGKLTGIPTLVASARHDPIAPPVLGKAIAARIHGARYVEFERASHALPIQLADEVNALLADHLSTVEGSDTFAARS
jgi:pimeloyl-ACP methyl ester carboxylesterase